jgi:hypothetical protein
MKVIPRSTWVADRFEATIIREATDPLACITFTLCIKDLSGNLVYYSEFQYSNLKDVQDVDVPVNAVLDGIYSAEIYYGNYNINSCTSQDRLVSKYPIHATRNAGTLVLGSGWSGSVRWLAVWTYGGRLFWKYRSGVDSMALPAGVDAFVEVTDDSGNAFADIVRVGTGTTYISPNLGVPFMVTLRIVLGQPVASLFVRYLTDFGGFLNSATIYAVDDYNVEVVIVKTRPGIWAIVALVLGLVVAICTWWMYNVEIARIEVEKKRLDTAQPLIDKYNEILSRYISEVSSAKSEEEVKMAQVRWGGALQTMAALVGQVLASGIGVCDGLRVGSTCVPWWVVGIGIFVAGLVVVSVLR